MKQFIILLFNISSISSFAQTKAIAFKSHSGDMKNFSIALENELFDDEGANFGLPFHIDSYRLASVTYLSPSKAVLKQYIYRKQRGDAADHGRYYATRIDTVYNDPLFSRKHALDSIKEVLKAAGTYDNAVEEILFVGYDNYIKVGPVKEKKKSRLTTSNQPKENNAPVVISTGTPTPNSLFDTKMIQALAAIFLLALAGGWFSWKYAGYRNKKMHTAQLTVA